MGTDPSASGRQPVICSSRACLAYLRETARTLIFLVTFRCPLPLGRQGSIPDLPGTVPSSVLQATVSEVVHKLFQPCPFKKKEGSTL